MTGSGLSSMVAGARPVLQVIPQRERSKYLRIGTLKLVKSLSRPRGRPTKAAELAHVRTLARVGAVEETRRRQVQDWRLYARADIVTLRPKDTKVRPGPILVVGLYAHSPEANAKQGSVAKSVWRELPRARDLYGSLPYRLHGALQNAGLHGRQVTLLALWVMNTQDVARHPAAKAFLRRAGGGQCAGLCELSLTDRLDKHIGSQRALLDRIAELRKTSPPKLVIEPILIRDDSSLKRLIRNDVPSLGHNFVRGLALAARNPSRSIVDRISPEVGPVPRTEAALLRSAIDLFYVADPSYSPCIEHRQSRRRLVVLPDDIVEAVGDFLLGGANLAPSNYRSHWGIIQFARRLVDEVVYHDMRAGPRHWHNWRFRRTRTSSTWPSQYRICAFADFIRWNCHRMSTLKRKDVAHRCRAPIRTSQTAEHFNWATCSDRCRQSLRFWKSKLGSTIRYRETHL